MDRLAAEFARVMSSFTPIPPPLTISVEGGSPTFTVDLVEMRVTAPGYWEEVRHLGELIGHEVKHASADGLPYTYRSALLYEALVMKRLEVPLDVARHLLNVVYDVVSDLRVAKEGLDVRGANSEWLKRFPVTPDAEGTTYHLLQILNKDFFGVRLRKTRYEEDLRGKTAFDELKRILASLAEAPPLQRDPLMVARAAEIIYNLSRAEPPEGGMDGGRGGQRQEGSGQGDRREGGREPREGPSAGQRGREEPGQRGDSSQGSSQGGEEGGEEGPREGGLRSPCDVVFDRSDPKVRAEAVEVGVEVGLSERQLAQLLGLPPGTGGANRIIEEAIEEKVRAALWEKIVGFKDLFMEAMMHVVKEPAPRRWRPYSRRVDPSSVARAPDDPRRWREPSLEGALTVEQEGEAGGFSKLVMLVDCSGSTEAFYGERTVLGYIKDAAYGLLAYARRFSLPAAVIAFNNAAHLISPESRDYLSHAKRIFTLRPSGGTNLGAAVEGAIGLKPKNALIAVLTDGLVREGDLLRLAEQAEANRVVAAVFSNEEGIRRVREVAGKVHIYVVKPDEAGRTIVSELPKPLLKA